MSDWQQPSVALAERLSDIAGDDAGNVVHLCRLLHPGRDIDCAAIDADGPLRIALLADHDLAAMDPDPEGWHDAKLLQKTRLLAADRRKDGVDHPQDPIVSDGLVPIPQRNEAVTLLKINFTAMIGDWLRDIEKELADQRFCADWTQLLREPCGIVDIEKGQDLLFDHWAVISADRQVK